MAGIQCLEDYLRSVKKEIESSDLPKEGLYTNYFRGQSNAKWDLVPSVFREHLFNEHNLFHEMERNLYHEMSNLSSIIDKLVYMQHQGLPTRLLDITKNSLVALYFACITHQDSEDGAVYIFSELENFDKKQVDIISLLSKVRFDFELNDFHKLAKEELHLELPREELLDALNKEFVLVKSNKNNNRVIKQDGDFFIFSNKVDYKHKLKFDVKRDENRIIIPKEYKKTLLDELNQIGINRYSLFPEPEHLAKYLKDNHSDNESETQKVISYDDIQKDIEDTKDNKMKIIEYLNTEHPHSKILYEFVKNSNIDDIGTRKELSKLAYSEIGIFDADNLEKFIDNLEIKPININNLF